MSRSLSKNQVATSLGGGKYAAVAQLEAPVHR